MTPFTDVFLYSRKKCPFCKVMKTKLDSTGIVYHEIDIDQNEKIRNELIAEGFNSTPVLSVDGKLMNGFEANQFLKEAGLL